MQKWAFEIFSTFLANGAVNVKAIESLIKITKQLLSLLNARIIESKKTMEPIRHHEKLYNK